jgi:hypothetical protein
VDQREHVTVAGDLLLGAILRHRLLGDERLDPGTGCMDVLDRVGRLRALDQRDPA